jgi:hypothetical protein
MFLILNKKNQEKLILSGLFSNILRKIICKKLLIPAPSRPSQVLEQSTKKSRTEQ